ncbi:MAG: hypothetical protein AB1894_21755 [Chloroflexota bacterium]
MVIRFQKLQNEEIYNWQQFRCFQHFSWKTYRIFDLQLISDFPFTTQITPIIYSDTPNQRGIIFTCVTTPPLSLEWDQIFPIYPPRGHISNSLTGFSIYHLNEFHVLRFADFADFYLLENHIFCHIHNHDHLEIIETQLFSNVLSFWLERQGIPVLHASAISTKGHAIAFLGHSGVGKTTLAASLIQEGCSLLTDDILPIKSKDSKFLAVPCYPQIRLWPDEAKIITNNSVKINPTPHKLRIRVGDDSIGKFCNEEMPIGCVYIMERETQGYEHIPITITRLSARQAFIELTRYSFMPRTVQTLGYQPHRLDVFASMSRQIPFCQLNLRRDLNYLSANSSALLKDIEKHLR